MDGPTPIKKNMTKHPTKINMHKIVNDNNSSITKVIMTTPPYHSEP